MDIVRTKEKQPTKRVGLFIGGGLGLSILVFFLVFDTSNASYLASKERLLVDEVQRGELNITVRGTGVLVPKDIRWITTDTPGRVDSVLIKAGALVEEGDVIMTLSNPQLVQSLAQAQWELQALEAETQARRVSLESELLDQEIAVLEQKLNYEKALITLNAQETLVEQGILAISKIDFEEVKIDVAQFKELWGLEHQRLEKRQENLQAQLAANDARLVMMRKRVEQIQQQVDALHITASMDSVLQEMPMEPGQQVSVGTNLAKLARSDHFIAQLFIPEKQVKDVAIGQHVTLDTRSSTITGKVQRIDPLVIDSTVQVDIEITGDLPKEARPELTVDGVIEVASIPNTLYVKRPMYADSFSDFDVYLLDKSGNQASKQTVSFGHMSSQFVEVLHGLEQGQSIIVSDTSNWQQHNQIRIN